MGKQIFRCFFVLAIISVITFGVINFDRRMESSKSDMVKKTQQIVAITNDAKSTY
ncbi:hypothetical protein MOMOMM089B2_08750 [Morganella morganii]|mgnify:CR=1 FL=1